MGTYKAAAALANRLMGSKGSVATFTRASAAAYDPIAQVETGSATTSFSMNAVGLPPGKSAEFRVGSLANRSIIELHLAPLEGTCPQPGDKVTWSGQDWTVIWVSALDPASDGPPYCLAYAER